MQTHAQGFDYPSIAEVECPFPMLSKIRDAGSVHQVGENRYLVSHYEDVDSSCAARTCSPAAARSG